MMMALTMMMVLSPRLDKKLQALGARPLVPYTDSDELAADGHESIFEKWHDELWRKLKVRTRVNDQKKHLPYSVKEHKCTPFLLTLFRCEI